MYDAFGFGAREGFSDLSDHVRSLRQSQASLALQIVSQVFSWNELHDQEIQPVALADVEDRDDVRMIAKRGRHSSLTLEAAHNTGIFRKVLSQYLDRNKAAMETVPCQIDLRHSAAAET